MIQNQNSNLTTDELAAYLKVSKPTLQRWRTTGDGPRFFKRGGVILYRVEDVSAWVNKHTRESLAQHREAAYVSLA